MNLIIVNNNKEKKTRKFYIDLLSKKKINQPEKFCSNNIKTTHCSL